MATRVTEDVRRERREKESLFFFSGHVHSLHKILRKRETDRNLVRNDPRVTKKKNVYVRGSHMQSEVEQSSIIIEIWRQTNGVPNFQ